MGSDGAPARSNDGRTLVFLSYSRVDRARAVALADAFVSLGCDVWWDRHITGGAAFAREIEAALDRADIVAVLWSASSRISDWVRDEAEVGRERGLLLPFSLDGREPPLGFRQTQAIDLSAWNGDADDRALLRAIEDALANRRKGPNPDSSGDDARLGEAASAAGSKRAQAPAIPEPRSAKSPLVAVLPFTDRGAPGLDVHFAQALSDEVLDMLACTAGLRVLGRASAARILEMKSDPGFARERLHVSWLVEGSITAGGDDRITASVHLIDTTSGEQTWTARFSRKSQEVSALQEDILGWVSQSLLGHGAKVKDDPPSAAPKQPYVDALVARHLIRLRQPDALSRAVALTDAAIEADPGFAGAYAMRALAKVVGNYYAAAPVRNARDVARAARKDAETAVKLAPDTSESFDALAMALHYSGDVTKAIAAAERAVSLNPNDAEARQHLGVFLSEDAQFDGGIEQLRGAAELDPLWPVPVVAQLLVYEWIGDGAAKAAVADRFRQASGDEASRSWVSAAEANARGEFARAIGFSLSAIELNSSLRYAVASRDCAREALFLTAGSNAEPAEFGVQGRRTASETVARALARGDAAWDGPQFTGVIATAFAALDRDRELLDTFRSRFGNAEGYEKSAPVIEQASVALATVFERMGLDEEAILLRELAADHLLRAETGGMRSCQTAVSWAALHVKRGQNARAIGILSAGFDEEWWAVARGPIWLGDSPMLTPLRGEPRFERLLRACADRINRERAAIGAPELSM